MSLRDRWRRFRNARLGDARFQRWAAGFPFTRPVALKSARALFDLTAGFVYSQILYSCVKLGVFEALADEPLTLDALARRIGLERDAAERLLRAAASLRLAERCDDGRWTLGDLGAAMLGAAGVREMVEHHAALYADLADPVALLKNRGGRIGDYWAYSRNAAAGALTPEKVADYSALMAASQATFLEDVVAAAPLRGRRRLLDVGGGEGRFVCAAAKAAPGLELAVFDLPAVAERAEARFAQDGVPARAHGGDFFNDALPEGYDLISLIRVCFDHDDAPALRLLGAVRKATPAGGAVMVAETMAGTPGAEPVGDAYFGFYLLAMGSGRPRTAAELTALLRAAGFGAVREARTARPMLARVLVATP
ncbi:demethylspheroidene O-methyltransferase [Rubrimonas cliftonensis]|uniref:Demethylspheroidene O-methyltransferase n=2 Tax=Rubrimonas cliftonensis TaxID=89524 RepID=A0A1H4BA16_9RHOB|nr:demethylspheroidene O-methyltransferase [Rubrimonas cliftonensis]